MVTLSAQSSILVFYIHVTMHRNKFLYNKTNQIHQFPKFTPAWNSTCFKQFLCPSSGVYSLYTQHWYMSYRFEESFQAGPGWNWFYSVAGGYWSVGLTGSDVWHSIPHITSILVLLKSCLQTCMTYTSAKCTVNKLLMVDGGQRNCLKHVEFHVEVNLGNWCIWLVLLQRNILVLLFIYLYNKNFHCHFCFTHT